MTDDDLNKIRTLVREEVTSGEKKMLGKMTSSEKRMLGKITSSERKMLDKMTSGEKRMLGKITSGEKRVLDKMDQQERRILTDIGVYLEDQLFPMLEEKADKTDIDRLERKIDNISTNLIDSEKRISNIESLPIIAHQLKSKN